MQVAFDYYYFLTNCFNLVSGELILTRLPLGLQLSFCFFVFVLLEGESVEKAEIFQLFLLTHASYL